MKAQGLKATPDLFRLVLDSYQAPLPTPPTTRISFADFQKLEVKVRARKELRILLDEEQTRRLSTKVDADNSTEFINPQASVYNEDMATAYANGEFQAFLQAFFALMQSDVNPDSITGRLLLTSFENGNEASAAYVYIESLRAQGATLDIFALNYVLVTLVKARAYEVALELLNLMKRDGKRVENLELNILIKLHCAHGSVGEATKWFDALKSQGYRADIGTYEALFELFSKIRDEEAALKALKDLRAEGLIPKPEMAAALRTLLN